jgi:8-oxo-dGTP pyrophosphatase MutT (NUDIX family)
MTRHHHLRRLLEAFTPADTQEREHQTRILQLLDSTPQSEAFSRAHYTPGHITASAFVLDPSRTSLLLILHGKLLKWLQPGGHVDPEDRDVLESARREVFEEVAVATLSQVGDGLFDLDVHPIPARGDQPAHEHFDVRFLFEAKDTHFAAGSDARDAHWVPIEQLLREGTQSEYASDESVLRAVRKLRGVTS